MNKQLSAVKVVLSMHSMGSYLFDQVSLRHLIISKCSDIILPSVKRDAFFAHQFVLVYTQTMTDCMCSYKRISTRSSTLICLQKLMSTEQTEVVDEDIGSVQYAIYYSVRSKV
jgi:hypothetical protein